MQEQNSDLTLCSALFDCQSTFILLRHTRTWLKLIAISSLF